MSDDLLNETCGNCKFFLVADDELNSGYCHGLPPHPTYGTPEVASPRTACSLFVNSYRQELCEFKRLVNIPWDKRTADNQSRLDYLSRLFSGC